jgi:hypothetical protein
MHGAQGPTALMSQSLGHIESLVGWLHIPDRSRDVHFQKWSEPVCAFLEVCPKLLLSPCVYPMPLPELPSRVHYTITPTKTGVNLCIWETAQVTDVRVKPFLFKIRHRLTSDTEAQQVLHEYLSGLV